MEKSRFDGPVPSHADVKVFPPLLPLTGFVAGLQLERLWPTAPWISAGVRLGMRGLGALVFCAGAVGFAWMVITMKKARTPIHTAATPTRLVESGPFHYTRNPMYLFGAIGYAGLALLLGQLWSLALMPLVHAATHYGVVLPEEQFLERRFGDAYSRYRGRVPRWL
jgi:protein-S-isoprenylcysteine O-methyltransferase Ste14